MGRCFNTLLIVIFAQTAYSYPTPVDFSGEISRWDITIESNEITYEVKAESTYDEAYFGSITDDAVTLWNDVPNSYIRLIPAATNEKAQVTVEFSDTIEGASFSSGYAIFDEYDEDNNPSHCQIAVLISSRLRTIQKTVLHEIGHCLGLGHTLVPEAIMSYSLDKNGYSLDTDDRAALSRIYPADGSDPQLPPGCSIPARGGKHGSNQSILFLLLLTPLLLRLKLTRKTLSP